MGIAKTSPVCLSTKKSSIFFKHSQTQAQLQKPNSMSRGQQQQEYHPQQEGIFAFPNGFDRSPGLAAHQDQIRRDHASKLRGFELSPPASNLVGMDHAAPQVDPAAAGLHPGAYETAGMLSEMFNFGHGPGPGSGTGPGAPHEILDYRRAIGGLGSDWYSGNRPVVRDAIEEHHNHQHHQQSDHQMPSINADSAAAMQLFLTNPPPRSPSPPHHPPQSGSGSTLHMLLPSPSNIQQGSGGGFHSLSGLHHSSAPPNPTFWGTAVPGAHINNPAELGGIVEAQGLSLSLSSSLQHLEAAKQPEDLRTLGAGDGHIMYFNNHSLQGFGPGTGPNSAAQHQVHLGFGSGPASSSLGVVNVLRNSKYTKPAQELLEEFCSVGRAHLKKSKLGRQNSMNPNPNPTSSGGAGSSSIKDPPQLSAADRIEHQRRKVKLLSMLDEVDRRYNHYCEQMQMVVNSFDLVMGYGAAIPYTALAQKAMSRHFRCLKDAIHEQLRKSCEVLGEKDPTASSGLSKGETPRLKMLEQSLRQQRAFHQMGMMEQEAWRPQRGLPERSVNILRAWLFEHFLHPYPNDADKHLLARQTGLSRNQVSNWFINARVRLWKPMVEDMYQQEAKQLEEEEGEEEDRERNQTSSSTSNTNTNNNTNSFATPHNPLPSTASETKRSSIETITPPPPPPHTTALPPPPTSYTDNVGPTTMIRFGTTPGDVSLTLGLRHAGNAPEKSVAFSVRDFGSC